MGLMATAETSAAAQLWGRLVHVSLGMLPGILYHLDISLAGLSGLYRTRIRGFWILSAGLTLFALFWPGFLEAPTQYPWGWYLRYTGSGLLIVGGIVIAVVNAEAGLRFAMTRDDPRSTRSQKLNVFFRGNLLTALALVDFLPAFGVGVYPFGYAVITIMHAATLYGSIRYRLIEITPEFAAEHVLKEMEDGLLVVDSHGLVRVANQPAADSIWCDLEGLIGRPFDAPGRNPVMLDLLRSGGDGKRIREISYSDPSGRQRHVRASVATITDQAGIEIALLWTLRDITGERLAQEATERFEAEVRSGQKLEGLGVMARGIAHDFNNLLLTIIGNAELAGLVADDAPAVRSHLEQIDAAAQRGSDLTRQMLTYAGVPTEQRPIALNRVITEVAELMGVAVSKKASLKLDLDPSLPSVIGDPIQMSQVILNLITNASEALEGNTGSIVLRTGVTRPDSTFRTWGDPLALRGSEDYVFLEAEDTGGGMSEDVLSKIFDPFFTTKFEGRGLGLATVVGIVRTHSGMTRVTSAPGRGTTFTIALPVSPEAEHAQAAPPVDEPGGKGRGRALVADDESAVRRVLCVMLERAGFQVIEAADGREAVSAFESRADDISVVVMDQTMPELDGQEAVSQIRAIAPDVPVVFISGFTDLEIGTLDSRTRMLHKPFKADALTKTIVEAMTGARDSRSRTSHDTPSSLH